MPEKYGVYQIQNVKSFQEDTYVCQELYNEKIYNFFNTLSSDEQKSFFIDLFCEMDKDIISHVLDKGSGSTAAFSVVIGKKIYVSTVGDSRSFACIYDKNDKLLEVKQLNAVIHDIPVTQDGQLDENHPEVIRIREAGGIIVENDKVYRLGKSLNMLRALGDYDIFSYAKIKGLIPNPHVDIWDIDELLSQYEEAAKIQIINVSDGVTDSVFKGFNPELHQNMLKEAIMKEQISIDVELESFDQLIASRIADFAFSEDHKNCKNSKLSELTSAQKKIERTDQDELHVNTSTDRATCAAGDNMTVVAKTVYDKQAYDPNFCKKISLIGVFDGHSGTNSDQTTAEYLRDNICKKFQEMCSLNKKYIQMSKKQTTWYKKISYKNLFSRDNQQQKIDYKKEQKQLNLVQDNEQLINYEDSYFDDLEYERQFLQFEKYERAHKVKCKQKQKQEQEQQEQFIASKTKETPIELKQLIADSEIIELKRLLYKNIDMHPNLEPETVMNLLEILNAENNKIPEKIKDFFSKRWTNMANNNTYCSDGKFNAMLANIAQTVVEESEDYIYLLMPTLLRYNNLSTAARIKPGIDQPLSDFFVTENGKYLIYIQDVIDNWVASGNFINTITGENLNGYELKQVQNSKYGTAYEEARNNNEGKYGETKLPAQMFFAIKDLCENLITAKGATKEIPNESIEGKKIAKTYNKFLSYIGKLEENDRKQFYKTRIAHMSDILTTEQLIDKTAREKECSTMVTIHAWARLLKEHHTHGNQFKNQELSNIIEESIYNPGNAQPITRQFSYNKSIGIKDLDSAKKHYDSFCKNYSKTIPETLQTPFVKCLLEKFHNKAIGYFFTEKGNYNTDFGDRTYNNIPKGLARILNQHIAKQLSDDEILKLLKDYANGLIVNNKEPINYAPSNIDTHYYFRRFATRDLYAIVLQAKNPEDFIDIIEAKKSKKQENVIIANAEKKL